MSDRIVGESIARIDVREKVTGKALYPGDFTKPDQLYMQVVFAEKAHAIVRKIDTSKAEALDGVLMVLTSKDVPCNEYGLQKADQPVLCGPDSGIAYADRVRFIGDQVALVIAENEMIAKKAAQLIEIQYEDLPLVMTIEEAMKDDAFLIHPGEKSNEITSYKIRFGDVEEGFKKADVIIEGDYETPAQEHAYLQPEAGMAYLDEEERITVIVAGQWTHEDQNEIAHALNIPKERIRVVYPAIGGAFGGREDMSVQIVLALAVLKLHESGIDRPVKTVWSRRESIIGHHKRHEYKIHTKWGATKDGKIIAAESEIIADAGAYMYTSNKVLANAFLMISGPYYIPNVKVDARAICTTKVPGGAFRGFGGPQACFAAEMQINKIAEALHMDQVEIRLLNTIKEGQNLSVGTPPPPGVSIDHVIKSAVEAAGWEMLDGKWINNNIPQNDEKVEVVYGIGVAAGFKNVGFSYGGVETCWTYVRIEGKDEIEKVIVKNAAADVGQGVHTVVVQITADIIGVLPEKVEMIGSDTAKTGNSGSASASRLTFMAGNATVGAAREAKEKWDNGERPAESTFIYHAPATTHMDDETGHCTPNITYGYAAEVVEVSVNKKTGKVLVEKVICADDVGKAINPQQVKGQIEGCIVQASGYTLLENFVQRDGRVLTDSLATYLIPTILDIPKKSETIIVEDADPRGPLGARGVGEMPYLPFAPAVLSAVHNATGVWYNKFPLVEERVLEGLGTLKK